MTYDSLEIGTIHTTYGAGIPIDTEEQARAVAAALDSGAPVVVLESSDSRSRWVTRIPVSSIAYIEERWSRTSD